MPNPFGQIVDTRNSGGLRLSHFYCRLFRWNERRWRARGVAPLDDTQLAVVVRLAFPDRGYAGTYDVAGWRRRYNRGELCRRKAPRAFRYENLIDAVWARKRSGLTKTCSSPEISPADALSAVLQMK